MEKIVLVGGGGHCNSILDTILRGNEFEPIGITEKNDIGKEILGVKIIGDDTILDKLYKEGIKYAFISVGSVGDTTIRKRIESNLKKIGFKLPSIIDPSAVVAKSAVIEEGVFIGKKAVVNSLVVVKKNAIINTTAIVEHDCVVGEFSHISSGSTICGGCKIGDNSHVGAGSVIIEGVSIGNNSIVGAGSVIIRNVKENSKVFGNPGRVYAEE